MIEWICFYGLLDSSSPEKPKKVLTYPYCTPWRVTLFLFCIYLYTTLTNSNKESSQWNMLQFAQIKRSSYASYRNCWLLFILKLLKAEATMSASIAGGRLLFLPAKKSSITCLSTATIGVSSNLLFWSYCRQWSTNISKYSSLLYSKMF